MRHYGFARRGRARKVYSARIVHVPSTMDQTMLTNDQAVVFAVVSTVVAGTSATTGRLDTDRDREVSSGEQVGRIDFNVNLEPATGATGTIEYIVWKVERSAITPVVGTFPIPSDADVLGTGLQQSYRLNMPGWVMKFGSIGISQETPRTLKVIINPKKFKKATIRDGDFIGITLFNRTGGSCVFGVQMRYSSWR